MHTVQLLCIWCKSANLVKSKVICNQNIKNGINYLANKGSISYFYDIYARWKRMKDHDRSGRSLKNDGREELNYRAQRSKYNFEFEFIRLVN
jgi:hypothetical protein